MDNFVLFENAIELPLVVISIFYESDCSRLVSKTMQAMQKLLFVFILILSNTVN